MTLLKQMVNKKKYPFAVLSMAIALLNGCANTENKPAEENTTTVESEITTEETATVSMYDLRKAMEGADSSLPEMLNASPSDAEAETKFTYLSDMEYDKVESFFMSYSSSGLADEIAVICVKDEADLSLAEMELEEHKTSRIKLYEQYDPQQKTRAEKGIVFTHGKYAVLIICDNSSAVKTAFLDFVGA